MQLDLLLLLALNVAAFASLAVGLAFWLKERPSGGSPRDVAAAFGMLELALRKAFPDLPQGFTWREGIAEARKRGVRLNWTALDGALRSYEAYRYGQEPAPAASPQPDLLKLLKVLGGPR